MSRTDVAAPEQLGATRFPVWVRRCQSCAADDLSAAFGRPEIIGDGPWRCPACAAACWEPARRDFQTDIGSQRCPYGGGPT